MACGGLSSVSSFFNCLLGAKVRQLETSSKSNTNYGIIYYYILNIHVYFLNTAIIISPFRILFYKRKRNKWIGRSVTNSSVKREMFFYLSKMHEILPIKIV